MQTSLSSALSIIGREALRIVLPSWCVVCGRELPWRDRVASCCRSCWSSLPRIESAKCRSCALPLPAGESCISCSVDPLPSDWCDAWGEYRGGLERLLHAFKFEHHDFLDAPLAELLHETLLARGDLGFDAVVPVPMHRSKERRRGYNQAQLLGSALARRIGVRCEPDLLTKPEETATQSMLSRGARAANVRRAFMASPGAPGKAILVVDDICTTAETVRACARELLAQGASRVCAVTVAKAV
ncbi:MAG TPA: ComF family protein [Thermoanaerobaculia bacterium]|nr:ComF family protein [Thermoanaerobaculia bacterium]